MSTMDNHEKTLVRKWFTITTIEAVNGLWLSGWFGTLVGICIGNIIGIALGIIGAAIAAGYWVSWEEAAKQSLPYQLLFTCGVIFFYGLGGIMYGALIGSLVGALTGLPAGVLSAGMSKRKEDCKENRGRIGGALAALLIGCAVAMAKYCYAVKWHFCNMFEREAWFLPLLVVLVLLFTTIGYVSGLTVDAALAKGDKDLIRCNARVRARGIQTLNGGCRALCTVVALMPVVLLYSHLIGWYLRS